MSRRRKPIGTPTVPSVIAALIIGAIGYFLTFGGLHLHTAELSEETIFFVFFFIAFGIVTISEFMHPNKPKW